MADLSEIEFGFSSPVILLSLLNFKDVWTLSATLSGTFFIFFPPLSLQTASLLICISDLYGKFTVSLVTSAMSGQKRNKNNNKWRVLFMCACTCASWGVGWATGWFFCPRNHDNSHLETAGKGGMATYTQGDSDVWGPPDFFCCAMCVCAFCGPHLFFLHIWFKNKPIFIFCSYF